MFWQNKRRQKPNTLHHRHYQAERLPFQNVLGKYDFSKDYLYFGSASPVAWSEITHVNYTGLHISWRKTWFQTNNSNFGIFVATISVEPHQSLTVHKDISHYFKVATYCIRYEKEWLQQITVLLRCRGEEKKIMGFW